LAEPRHPCCTKVWRFVIEEDELGFDDTSWKEGKMRTVESRAWHTKKTRRSSKHTKRPDRHTEETCRIVRCRYPCKTVQIAPRTIQPHCEIAHYHATPPRRANLLFSSASTPGSPCPPLGCHTRQHHNRPHIVSLWTLKPSFPHPSYRPFPPSTPSPHSSKSPHSDVEC